MSRIRIAAAAAIVLTASIAISPTAQTPAASAMFRFSADDMWLNLHHFLWVLGRAENKAPDAGRVSVAGAPVESAAGLAGLSDAEQAAWRNAITAYAATLSRIPSVLALELGRVAIPLSAAGDTPTLDGVAIDPAVRAVLESAAPVYRKAWWPAHRSRHQVYHTRATSLLERHGRVMHDFITRIYGLRWPADGFPIHYAAYVSPQGNYSIGSASGPMLVLETNENPANVGLYPLEILFHEGMHQWDADVATLLRGHAERLKVTLPIDLSHALIFYTAGEAVRTIDPAFVPLATFSGVWGFRLSGAPVPAERLLKPLREVWQPYLDGRGTRDEAMAAMVAAAAAVSK
jgi:hypothetical protein